MENSPSMGGCMIWQVGGWVDGWDQVKWLKFNKSWPNRDNSILFEDLWFVETLPPMDGVCGLLGGSGQMTKNLINLDLIEIIQFCLKIYDLQRDPTCGYMWGWLGGSVGQWVGSGQMTNIWINFDLIEMIQFCLKIYNLYRHPNPLVGGWVGQ